MYRIFNWIFSSFFRTLGRILVYILIGFLLCYLLKDVKIPGLFNILQVNALTIQDGINQVEIKQPANAKFHNINANGMTDISTTFGQDVPVYESQMNLNPNGYGGAVSFEVEGGFLAGYNYAITTYIGFTYDSLDYYVTLNNRYSNQNAICNFGYCSGNWNGGYYFSSVKYSRGYTPQIINIPYGNGLYYGFYATQILYIFTANASAESVLIPFNANISTSLRSIYLLGYNIEQLGQNDLVTNSSLNSAIANSGLATASSVSSVQNSVNQVQQEVQGTTNAIDNQTQQQQANHEETMDTITDSNTSESTNSASSFFSNFNTNTHGLTGIITAPLTAIQSLSSKTCSPLVLPLPFVNENLTLPCMRTIYDSYFGDFMRIYDIITLGIISYWVMVRIFAMVKDFKNPEHDEIEVVDL